MAATKTLARVEVKDADKGTVAAVFATFNVKDKDGDVTVPGAFTDGADVVISAYGHTSWEGKLPVGVGTIRTTKSEAVLDGEFFLDTTGGADTFTAVKRLAARGLGEWSYGYDAVKFSFGEHDGDRVRFLEEQKVHEVSPVLLGAGVNTRTLAAKSAGMRFGEHGSAVLTEVRELVKRATDVMALRAEKGKTLSAESTALLEELDTELKALRAVLDAPGEGDTGTPDDDELKAAVASELLRFTRITSGR